MIAEGTWDARGTLGVDRDAPVGIQEVRLTFEIDSSADSLQLEKLVEITKRYCVIYRTLADPPSLSTRLSASKD